ncbi:MAG: BamA/TamA family outer membrane protein [Phaeovulum sp.]|uniref:autotransporter assembly complex protein TamA n=1 Tax=Phaeovulum sp. TaxID=2934796 RepID=UPI00273673AB|nr:BamA/TamA family outer membrane protein [Phaeovulum sp.]MDP3860446.1 BamA/TamA family outer membrane protein [Phaeovulum sp.]
MLKAAKRWKTGCWLAGALALAGLPAAGLEQLVFEVPGADAALSRALEAASLTRQAEREGRTAPQDLLAAARADYARLLAVLYAQGHYAGTIGITLDGREAAAIALLDAPGRVDTLRITVRPGARFAFSSASVAPLAPGTALPEGFAPGAPAFSGVIGAAAAAAIGEWRDAGHAKAEVAAQSIVADHRSTTLAAAITLRPGPQLLFGALATSGTQRLRPERLAEIAGLPTGEVFSPAAVARVQARLRRSGIFSSAVLGEAALPGLGDSIDMTLAVIEAPLRRFGIGAELSSRDGGRVSAFWLHRNLWGGGERLRVEGEVTGIGTSAGGADLRASLRLDRPATFSADTQAFAEASAARLDEVDHRALALRLGFGLAHDFSDALTGSVALRLSGSRVTDAFATETFRQLSLPVALTFDRRDSAADPMRGYWLDLGVTPFAGFGATGSGVQLRGEARGYRALGGRAVLAGRAQIGSVLGSALLETPREYLFHSGGGGSVRGQPYQSLGVEVLRGFDLVPMGGASFAAFSGELRGRITENIGLVAFYDAGFVGLTGGFADGGWHAGAGLGLRYDTGIGPIRLDLAMPVAGNTGDGLQIYLGIGQAF